MADQDSGYKWWIRYVLVPMIGGGGIVGLIYSALTDATRENWRKIEILGIKVQTARELQQTGYDLSKDRVFGSMNLSLDDYAVTVKSRFENRTGGMLVVVRRKGNKFEIAGMWD